MVYYIQFKWFIIYNSNGLLKNYWGMKKENINQLVSAAATVHMYRIQLLYNIIVYSTTSDLIGQYQCRSRS